MEHSFGEGTLGQSNPAAGMPRGPLASPKVHGELACSAGELQRRAFLRSASPFTSELVA